MEVNRYNYYDILEVSQHCAQHEITTAYERAKKTYAGDNAAIYTIFSEEEARDLLKLIEEAYSVLGNKTLRTLYDEKINHGSARKEDVSLEALKMESKTILPDPPKKSAMRLDYKVDPAFEAEVASWNDWDGTAIKKVREYKNAPIELMAEVTKVGPYYIRAVEAMDPKNLPATVFVRGYVVQIAKYLGLNDKKVADSYMKIFKSKIENKA